MSDALDRAARALYEQAISATLFRERWDDKPDGEKDSWRAETAAALRVMADGIRALHTEETAFTPDGDERTFCAGCGAEYWPCPTVRILDGYTGSGDE